MIIKKIKDEIYHANIRIMACCDENEVADYFKKTYSVECGMNDAGARVFTLRNEKKRLDVIYLIIPIFDWTIQQQALLVHELFHITYIVLSAVGIKLSDDSDEAYAYYLQYLTTQVVTMLLKKTGYADRQIQKRLAGEQ